MTLERKLVDGFRLENPKHAPEIISELMQQCWSENPDERPTFLEFMQRCDNCYNLNEPFAEDQCQRDESNNNNVKLKYVTLTLHEKQLEQQFNSIKEGNSR